MALKEIYCHAENAMLYAASTGSYMDMELSLPHSAGRLLVGRSEALVLR